jgi:glycosyltransferase involved in cell wall biosynthesis
MPTPIRILQIIGLLNRGGVEVWLMNVLRNIDRSEFQIDFLVHVDYPCAFDDEARQLGARIIRLKQPKHTPFSYRRKLSAILREHGPYDIVHSHVHLHTGFNLQTAASCGVPVRIAHSHDDSRRRYEHASLPRRAYAMLARRRILQYATHGLACSSFAAASLYGENWRNDPRWKVFHYGIDFTRFGRPAQPAELRAKLGIPDDRHVIVHLSRLDLQKNHEFSLRLLSELLTSNVNTHLLLVGGGPMEEQIKSQIQAANLGNRVTMVGDQADVLPFLALAECMVFPSWHEGLGIVVLEAQAAGLPCVASEYVPPDVSVLPGMVQFCSLAAPLSSWVDAIKAKLNQPRLDRHQTVAQMDQSSFGLSQCLEQLCAIYRGQPLDRFVSSNSVSRPLTALRPAGVD